MKLLSFLPFPKRVVLEEDLYVPLQSEPLPPVVTVLSPRFWWNQNYCSGRMAVLSKIITIGLLLSAFGLVAFTITAVVASFAIKEATGAVIDPPNFLLLQGSSEKALAMQVQVLEEILAINANEDIVDLLASDADDDVWNLGSVRVRASGGNRGLRGGQGIEFELTMNMGSPPSPSEGSLTKMDTVHRITTTGNGEAGAWRMLLRQYFPYLFRYQEEDISSQATDVSRFENAILETGDKAQGIALSSHPESIRGPKYLPKAPHRSLSATARAAIDQSDEVLWSLLEDTICDKIERAFPLAFPELSLRKCRLEHAQRIDEGILQELKDSPTTTLITVGSDQDEHGCIPSAGYSWCDSLAQCHRPWETPCEISNASNKENDEDIDENDQADAVESDEEKDKVLLGNDLDDHGCNRSAGFSWCEASQSCYRVWETSCGEGKDGDWNRDVETDIETVVKAATESFLLGHDLDEHGCNRSAGFSWCKASQSCLRVWETACGEESGGGDVNNDVESIVKAALALYNLP